MRTERYELRDEPCAAGKWRGGIGMVRVNRFLVDTIVTCEGERQEADLPWGIFGGQDGHPRPRPGHHTRRHRRALAVEVHGQDAEGRQLRSRSRVPNSGGYGDPLERDPELVRSDVLDGFTTAELAERDYGVVLSPDGGAVDVESTERLRERLRGAGASLTA